MFIKLRVRLLVLICFLSLAPRPGWGAITQDQTTGKVRASNVGSSTNFSFSTAPAAGSFVVVTFWGWKSGGYNASSVTDNQGNTYTLVTGIAANRARAAYAYASNVTSSGTFTITINNSGSSGNYLIECATSFTGVVTSSPADASGSAEADSDTTVDANVTASGANSQSDELVVAVMTFDHSSANDHITTPTTGYSELVIENDGSTFVAGEAAYKVVSAAETSSATWTHDNANGEPWGAMIVTFKAAAASDFFGKRRMQ